MMFFEETIFQDKEVVSGVPLKFLLKICGLGQEAGLSLIQHIVSFSMMIFHILDRY